MEEIKNLKAAAERIKKAIKKKEKIILYGDADLDGAASVIILKETIKNLGGEIVAVYFPDREMEGYGITEKGLNFLSKYSPALLIAMDCGIGNFKEVKLAKKMGFKVIIIDHHEVLDKLPTADIIVDPKQKDDKYHFKNLANTGIVFKLSSLILNKKSPKTLIENFLELTALATIADMMPREDENKIFIAEGLSLLKNSWRPGIKELLKAKPFRKFDNLNEKISKIISILNIRDVESNLPASFRVLTAASGEEARKIIRKLLEKSELRKEKIKDMLEEIEEMISGKEEPLIFEGKNNWEYVLMGPVASIICQKHQKPTFIYKKLDEESQGAVRVPAGKDSVILMKKCSRHLLTYGGHPQASGFRIDNKKLERFKKCLIKNYMNHD